MNQDFNTAFANFMQKAQIAVNADYRLTGGSTTTIKRYAWCALHSYCS